MKHIIITGASRGFGEHIARISAADDTTLHLVARSNMDSLKSELSENGAEVLTYKADLTKTEDTDKWFSQIVRNIQSGDPDAIILYNNAGMLYPMGPIGKHDMQDYRKNLELNFVAALLVGHQFIQHFRDYEITKRIINISSGAANNPYNGWSHYCSTKAGLDMFTRCISLEQQDTEFPVEALSFSPGPLDTQMQDEIRDTSPEDFANVDKFISLKEQNMLGDPEKVAGVLHDLVWSKDFPNGKILDIMDVEG